MKQLLPCLLPLALFVSVQASFQDESEPSKTQEAFQVQALVEQMQTTERGWLSFLDRKDLSCGVYRLKAGAKDGQSPHTYDEVYYVVEGKGTLTAGGDDFACEEGSILYVAKDVEHRFRDITEDLTIVVFFAKGGPKPKADQADEGGRD